MRHARLAILASTALTIAGAVQAQAADWTGFYAGANIGYSFGRTDATVDSFTLPPPYDPVVLPGGNVGLKPNGIIGGMQLGYNWQAGSWVYGLETDFQFSGQKDSKQVSTLFFDVPCNGSTNTCDAISSTDVTAKLSWFGTLRTRIGQDFSGLFGYVTGGLAYGRIKISGTNTIALDELQNGTIDDIYQRVFSVSKTKAGWTIGAGIEGQTGANNWTWRLEYLFLDFGNVGLAGSGLSGANDITDHIVRLAVNYRFPPRP
jgi:outer membrane immunogenic protein